MEFITQQVCAGEKCFLDIEQVCHLRSIGIKWKEIATMMGVSRMTLYCKRKEAEINDHFQFSTLSCEELQTILLEIKPTVVKEC